MHEYHVLNHDRKNIYYFCALLSIFIGGIIAWGLTYLHSTSGLFIAAPSGLAIFGGLFLFFDRFVWCSPVLYSWGIIKIPNLNGSWEASIRNSQGSGAPIKATVQIHQTYTKMKIRLETENSCSLSKMAAFEMADPSYFFLRYEYIAEYKRDQDSNILRHYGVTCVELRSFDHNFIDSQAATYYTEQGRDTHGNILINRVKCHA